jgi:UDP-2,3-diacylglucosamine pyrophosphatase LpxH
VLYCSSTVAALATEVRAQLRWEPHDQGKERAMERATTRWVVPAFVAGIAMGVGIAFLRASRAKKHPDDTAVQRSINRALSKTLRKARRENRLQLDSSHRYVIFSDHHKGARNEADDFRQCELTYLAALDHYLPRDYALVVMGDAEELWEEKPESVMEKYRNVFESEARFYPDRYIRIYGNHDDAWESEKLVEQHLYPFFPQIRFNDGLILEFLDEERGTTSEIFLVHGHQGTIESDVLASLSRRFLPFYREFQIRTGWGRTMPAEDACLRAEHDSQMYRWASKQRRLLLIAGHTHRPIWSSRTHLEKLLWELYALQQLAPADRPSDYEEKVSQLEGEIRRRERKYPPCTDTVKTIPCYFNTGCCRFEDGDITGIELEAGQIRLVKWGEENGSIVRKILEETILSEVFFFL